MSLHKKLVRLSFLACVCALAVILRRSIQKVIEIKLLSSVPIRYNQIVHANHTALLFAISFAMDYWGLFYYRLQTTIYEFSCFGCTFFKPTTNTDVTLNVFNGHFGTTSIQLNFFPNLKHCLFHLSFICKKWVL